MLEHHYIHRVRYRECDPMGVVYHAHYVDYFEYARTEALRIHGLPYRALEDSGIIMPVLELNVRYHQSAYYDDLLDVHVAFKEIPTTRITAEYTIQRREPKPSTKPLITGKVMLCFVDTARGRPVRAPQQLVEIFEALQ